MLDYLPENCVVLAPQGLGSMLETTWSEIEERYELCSLRLRGDATLVVELEGGTETWKIDGPFRRHADFVSLESEVLEALHGAVPGPPKR